MGIFEKILNSFWVEMVSFCSGKEDFLMVFGGITLLIVPAAIFIYGEKIFCKLREGLHYLAIRSILEKPSVSFSNQEIVLPEFTKPDNISKSEAKRFKDIPGNFLPLVCGIDYQLRIIASKIENEEFPFGTDMSKIDKIIRKEGILTRQGKKKMNFIRWLRRSVEMGRTNYLSPKAFLIGVCIAWEMHQELNLWLMNEIR